MRQPEQGQLWQNYNGPLSNHPLDIVRDCEHLAGRFPPNVRILFALGQHDPSSGATANISKLYEQRLGEQFGSRLSSAERIGVELAYTGSRDRVAVNAMVANIFLQINQASEQWRKGEEYPLNHVTGYQAFLRGIVIGAQKQESHDRLPQLFPIDSYDSIDIQVMIEQLHEQLKNGDLVGYVKNNAAHNRLREALILGQLADAAGTMGKDGGMHDLGVVQGLDHFLTPIAAKALGANVEPINLSNRPISTMQDINIRLRTGQIVSDKEISLYYSAETVAAALLGNDPAKDEYTFAASAPLSWSCLQGLNGTLPRSLQYRFNGYLSRHWHEERISPSESLSSDLIAFQPQESYQYPV